MVKGVGKDAYFKSFFFFFIDFEFIWLMDNTLVIITKVTKLLKNINGADL